MKISEGVRLLVLAGVVNGNPLSLNFLQHFDYLRILVGVIHDYNHCGLLKWANPLFQTSQNPAFISFSFDDIHKRVNPIATRYW